jgi:hypothetical protein
MPDSAKLALQLEFVKGVLHPVEAGNRMLKSSTSAQQINRIEVHVLFGEDTLAHTTIAIPAGDSTFMATLNVAAGKDRRIVVEAWSDNTDVESLLEYRGVESGLHIESGMEQRVAITLYPVAISGRRVVMIAGNGSGGPGSGRNPVPISLISADSLAALQLDVHASERDNPASFGLLPRDVVKDIGLPLQNLDSNVITTANSPTLRVVLFDDAGRSLPPMEEPGRLFDVEFQVNPEVTAGTIYRLWMSNFVIRDANNHPLEVLSLEGEFKVR